MTRAQSGLDDETLEMVLGTLRTLTDRRLGKATRLRMDEEDQFPMELVREMLGPELGLHLLFLPAEVGGLGGGARDLFRVSEEMARVDLGVATAFLAIALGVDPIIVGGTEAQKKRFLTRIAEEGMIVAYGVTEPTAGSDVARIRTVAEPVTGPDGTVTAYRISGTKQFITNGGVAGIYTILARAPGGLTFFVVERELPGLSVGVPEKKHGVRASNTAQVILDQVEVPADHLLGGVEGCGLDQSNQVFGFTRLMVAAFGLGAGEEALQRAINYGLDREQFGGPLYDKQGFSYKLIVPHAVRLEAARAYCEEMSGRLDAGEPGLQVEGSVAKLFATEAGNAAADAAIQAHGGYGYTHEYEVEKISRDVRITTIYEGTSEIQQTIIGTHRWRATVRSKGGFFKDMATSLRKAGIGEAAAMAADALAETILAFHGKRLPREQYILMELGRLAAEVETAVALARKAAKVGAGDGELLSSCAKLHAQAAARDVGVTTLRLAQASDQFSADELRDLRTAIRFDDLLATAKGELVEMERVAKAMAKRG